VHHIGLTPVFLFLAAVAAGAFGYPYFFMPETNSNRQTEQR